MQNNGVVLVGSNHCSNSLFNLLLWRRRIEHIKAKDKVAKKLILKKEVQDGD